MIYIVLGVLLLSFVFILNRRRKLEESIRRMALQVLSATYKPGYSLAVILEEFQTSGYPNLTMKTLSGIVGKMEGEGLLAVKDERLYPPGT